MVYTKEEYIKVNVKQLKEKVGVDADMGQLEAIVKYLGIAAQGGDASLVSCGQESEMNTKVCEDLGVSNTQKYRAAFYYLLAKQYGKTL